MKKTAYYSWKNGTLPKGCQMCVKGQKLVLFVTGLCPRNCFYCPISEKKHKKDVVYADEWPIKNEKEILKLAHRSASEIMDTDNMYISLYNKRYNEISFGLVYEKGKEKKREPREKEEGSKEGKTEYIIRTGKSLFHPTRKESEEWYNENDKKPRWDKKKGALPPSPSWLGVPMRLGDDNIGAIATYHPTEEHLYTEEDIGILQLMANSVAIALNNIKLHKRSSDVEKISYLSQQVGSLAHRMGNKCGMIRLCVFDLQDHFAETGFHDEIAINNIDTIGRANQYLLDLHGE